LTLALTLARLTLAALLLAPTAGAAQTLTRYAGLAMDPSGARIAAVESVETEDSQSAAHGVVVVRAADGSVQKRIDPCATCRYAGLAFSPDGAALAFIASDPRTGEARVMLASGEGTRVLASLKGLLYAPKWSPDGSRLAVLATAAPHKEAGATQAGKALAGEIGAEIDEQRIAVVPVRGGALRLLSPADTYVYEYAWLKDGQGFVATAAKGDGDDNWWVAKLVRFDAEGRERVIAAPAFQINAPSLSPDGTTVAVIGGLMSDFGSVGGDVYAAKVSGGPLTNLTPDLPASVSDLAWTKTGLLALALEGARQEILRIAPEGGAARVETLPMSAPGARFAVDAEGGRLAFVGANFTTAPELFAGPLTAPRAVTSANAALPARVRAESVSWVSDGRTVQGWLLGPTSRRPGVLSPMVTLVHGGPSAASLPDYVSTGTTRALIERGYFVFMPNPRGSYGQGEAFTRANVKDLGGGDLTDILRGIDAVERAAPVDERRLGIFGHSYGGFMTMWAVAHTDRFHAAVAGAGIADWLSYYGENGIDKWMAPFFGGSPYDDASVYDRLSPIRTIRAAKTPTFIYVGDRDVECPAAQSLEFWHGLKEVGVPTSLVVYPDEGHAIRAPEHRKDLTERILAWFDRYLAAP
jgi:dipeptidyl aminopeptidase/acylaminoacyl peptidase